MNLTALRTDALRNISYQITTADYSTTDIDAALNKWYRLAVGWVIGATGIWEFQGEKSTTDLVNGQAEYVLPTGMVYINRVSIKYPNATNYVVATRIDDLETTSAFENGTISQGSESAPVYREFDNSLYIYPVPSAGVTAGLAIETVNDVTDLSAGGDLPNINPLIHQVLSLGAALDFCDAEEMYNKSARLERRIFGRAGGDGKDGLKFLIEELAANRDRSTRNRIIPRRTSFK